MGRFTYYFWEDLQVMFGKTYRALLGSIAELTAPWVPGFVPLDRVLAAPATPGSGTVWLAAPLSSASERPVTAARVRAPYLSGGPDAG